MGKISYEQARKDHDFDAEDPDGVADPGQMQYHRRLRAIADSPEWQSESDAVRQALGRDPEYYGSAFQC